MNNAQSVRINSPLVSVVTPSYNQGRFIQATIESVLGQDYPNIEYIVMDGGSSDETVSILQKYGNRLSWVSENDKGQTDAINKGLRKASGEIVAYLNSDDIYLPNTISKVVEIFVNNPDVDFIYGDFHAIDENGHILDKVKTIPFDHDILLYDANYICQPGSFYRRRLLDEIGLFDDELHFLMDYEFFLRAAKRKAEFFMMPEYLSAIRYHGDCKTLSDGVYPWVEERKQIKLKYARVKARSLSSLRILSLIFRLKRYYLLLLRGRLDCMNIFLAYKLRKISR
ncbi:MAG: glycosyltransferase [Candidatus Heimdallarchaeota archaeon]|nr:glycosyltransferase [Candidatus Heimdallarchaeota archaeon]